MIKSLQSYNGWSYYFIVVIFSVLLAFAVSYLFISDDLYYLSLGEQLATERITSILDMVKKWQWLGYAFIPVIVFLRVSFTSICLFTGVFIANIKARFRDLFKVALLADFAFVASGFAKLVTLIFFKKVNTLEDLQFQPLSLMELFEHGSVDPLFVYPLSLVNLFELIYWLALAWLLTGIIEKPMGKTFKLVASSYGVGLLMWVIFVMFLTVNLS